MDNTIKQNNDTVGTLLKWVLGTFVAWNLLPPGVKENASHFLYQLSDELVTEQRRKVELERRLRINKIIADFSISPSLLALDTPKLPEKLSLPQSASTTLPTTTKFKLVPSSAPYTKVYVAPDSIWLKRIIHPSIVLIVGKRGSGKSASAYRILELFRFGPKPYIVGVPTSKQHLLPEWISIVPSLGEVPPGAVVVIDEAYMLYHARSSTAQESREMSKLINLSRQREQTIIFVAQEARQIDRNIASSANVIIFKELGLLQLQFDRPEFNRLAIKAKEAFATISGDKRRWSYIYSPDTNYSGLIENELPSFWTPGLSRMFAGEVTQVPTTSKPRIGKVLTPVEKAQKASEMQEQGASIREIARTLGVSPGTVINYLKGYPYRNKEIS